MSSCLISTFIKHVHFVSNLGEAQEDIQRQLPLLHRNGPGLNVSRHHCGTVNSHFRKQRQGPQQDTLDSVAHGKRTVSLPRGEHADCSFLTSVGSVRRPLGSAAAWPFRGRRGRSRRWAPPGAAAGPRVIERCHFRLFVRKQQTLWRLMP